MWSMPIITAEEELAQLQIKHGKLQACAESFWQHIKYSPDFLRVLRQPARNKREIQEKLSYIKFYGYMEDFPINFGNLDRSGIESYSKFIYDQLMQAKE